MFDLTTLLAFAVASGAIILAPGPAQALVLARTVGEGRRAGAMTALGVNLAVPVHALAAGLGLSGLMAGSALAFSSVKLVGAAYLAYLGARAILSANAETETQKPTPAPPRVVLVRAFVTGILNPKVALFFLAFLPQFVHPNRGSVLVQFLVLGALLAAMDIVYELVLVHLASRATLWLDSVRARRWRQRVTGTVLLGLAAKLAFVERD